MLKFTINLFKPVLLLTSYAILPYPVYSDGTKSSAIGRSSTFQSETIDKHGEAGRELTFAKEPTDEEALLNLNRRLNSLLQDFDELLLNEQELLTQRKNASGSSSVLGSGDDQADSEETGASNASGSETGAEAEQIPEQGMKNGQTTDSRATKPGIQADSGSKQAPGVRGGNDDDVVARQLREAAEKETDPVLKKKLWDEYRNYKNQQ